jgi:hypothetical protein
MIIKMARYIIIARSTTVSGIWQRLITMKRSVIGVVRAMKISADIPPMTLQNTKMPWLRLSRVTESESQGNGSQLQYTSFPPDRRIITRTLMTANQNGTIKSSAYVFISTLARRIIAQDNRTAIKRGAMKLVDRRQRMIAPVPATSFT